MIYWFEMAAEITKKKRWIFPSDRELILRAKLNTGWSVHTQKYFKKPEPILESELRSIESVIERAKEADYIERERVRKMICKLENMRKSSIGDGKNTCSMCGVYFGFFRTAIIKCSDCNQAVCEKCRNEMHDNSEESILCKVCSEYREVWKKSGGWFYGVLPQVEKLDSDELKCCQKNRSDKWAHRARDIVRLESFEEPEKNLNNKFFYKTWAIGSSPELNSIEDTVILRKYKKNKLRKNSEGFQLEKEIIPSTGLKHISKMSVSCPSLQSISEDKLNTPKKKSKNIFSKKKLLKPARKVIAKVTKQHKKFK